MILKIFFNWRWNKNSFLRSYRKLIFWDKSWAILGTSPFSQKVLYVWDYKTASIDRNDERVEAYRGRVMCIYLYGLSLAQIHRMGNGRNSPPPNCHFRWQFFCRFVIVYNKKFICYVGSWFYFKLELFLASMLICI